MNENIIESIAAKYTPEDAASRDQVKQAIREALSKSGLAVPDGWKLVPLKPTPEMMDAAWDHTPLEMDDMNDSDFGRAYQDMLAYAPAAPVPTTAKE